ncbi:MAG: class I SAM-dependent methyltransferase [Candidatus Electrothrix sp. LOE1_4_5]|nr:class I SAM-dependent methyltransferase [Candidatus Electrothrix gigas]
MKNQYYQKIRKNLIAEVSGQKNKILEVGCANGLTGHKLKKSGIASEVIGIEINPNAAKEASRYLDHVVCGDIETLSLEESLLAQESFDYIIYGDVLEHLRDPWTQLVRLKSLLKTNGHIIISLPNIRYWSVLAPLLFKGDWHYTDAGILDRTHLRFFTKKTAIELCQQAGFTRITCKASINRRLDQYFNTLSFGFIEEFVSPQWTLICKN